MRAHNWLLTVILILGYVGTVSAAEIIVAPGDGTLAAAIASASDGDTLILQDGGYYGAVIVNKSLIIRPINRATNAIIGGDVTIAGSGIQVTLQGLKFSAAVMFLQTAASIRLLENEWLSGDVNGLNYRSSEGDGSLVIVGNRFASGSDISNIYIDGAYIAGNVLFGGRISTASYVWIVGNEIITTAAPAINSGGSGATAYVLANRVRCNDQNTANCIDISAPSAFVAGNVVEVNDTFDDIYTYTQNGIYADGTGEIAILNNVIRGMPEFMNRRGSGIVVTTPSSRVVGNIIIDYISFTDLPINVTSTIAEVTHNLCWNNSGTCPEGEGNLDADPQFIDLMDYLLGPTSPAIDAGPLDFNLADLDRTRNDMGVHGGPWSISQYDVQRDPNSYAPYTYPLLKINSMLRGGILEYRALGVSRLR